MRLSKGCQAWFRAQFLFQAAARAGSAGELRLELIQAVGSQRPADAIGGGQKFRQGLLLGWRQGLEPERSRRGCVALASGDRQIRVAASASASVALSPGAAIELGLGIDQHVARGDDFFARLQAVEDFPVLIAAPSELELADLVGATAVVHIGIGLSAGEQDGAASGDHQPGGGFDSHPAFRVKLLAQGALFDAVDFHRRDWSRPRALWRCGVVSLTNGSMNVIGPENTCPGAVGTVNSTDCPTCSQGRSCS